MSNFDKVQMLDVPSNVNALIEEPEEKLEHPIYTTAIDIIENFFSTLKTKSSFSEKLIIYCKERPTWKIELTVEKRTAHSRQNGYMELQEKTHAYYFDLPPNAPETNPISQTKTFKQFDPLAWLHLSKRVEYTAELTFPLFRTQSGITLGKFIKEFNPNNISTGQHIQLNAQLYEMIEDVVENNLLAMRKKTACICFGVVLALFATAVTVLGVEVNKLTH